MINFVGRRLNRARIMITYMSNSNRRIYLINRQHQKTQSEYEIHQVKPLKFHSFVRFKK